MPPSRLLLPFLRAPYSPKLLRLPFSSRTFATSPTLPLPKPLPPLPAISDSDITESFLKGSGPGGQKINKTSSAVQLIHHPTGIVVKCQSTRSRSQNRKIARRLLAERLEVLEKGEQSRVVIKAERERKKKASKNKKSRRKYKKLAEGKEAEDEDEEWEDDLEEGEGSDEVTEGGSDDPTPPHAVAKPTHEDMGVVPDALKTSRKEKA